MSKRVYDAGPAKPKGFKRWLLDRRMLDRDYIDLDEGELQQLGAYTCKSCNGGGGTLVGTNWITCSTCNGKGYTT